MLNKHPVQTVFDHLTYIVAHRLPDPEPFEGSCSCCGRAALDFNFKAYAGRDGYGVSYMHCAACESFNVGDTEVLGIERNEKTLPDGTKTGVPHKFGMLAGSGVLIDSSGLVVVFTPPGTYKKLPKTFLETFTVLECSSFKQVLLLSKLDISYPALYIQDFGKKTRQLITGLRYSLNESVIIACSDSGNTSTTEFLNTLDLKVIARIVEAADPMPLSQFKTFKQQLAALCLGGKSPAEFTEFMNGKGTKEMMAVYQLLPKDPHVRLALMDMALKIKGG